jgi:hypothetical protein
MSHLRTQYYFKQAGRQIVFNSHSGGGRIPYLGPLGTVAITGLLYLPWVIVRIENLVERRLAGETEVLGENLPQGHFVHHKSHLTRPGGRQLLR